MLGHACMHACKHLYVCAHVHGPTRGCMRKHSICARGGISICSTVQSAACGHGYVHQLLVVHSMASPRFCGWGCSRLPSPTNQVLFLFFCKACNAYRVFTQTLSDWSTPDLGNFAESEQYCLAGFSTDSG